jgi:transglutaminase-like putative cysteine protease
VTADHRLAAASATATALTALALAPLVQGPGWIVGVTLTIIVLAVVGVLARRWLPWWPLVLLLQGGAVGLTLTQLFARQAAVGKVLPGPDTWSVLTDLARAGLVTTRQEIPPVPSSLGLMFVVALGMAVIGLLVDVIAVSLRKPAVAGLPLLAVYCVPAAVLPGGLAWPWFVFGAAGYLLLIAADSPDRVHSWGRVLTTGHGARRNASPPGGPLAGSRRLAAGCLVAAVVVPAVMPGLGEQLLGGEGEVAGKGPGGSITVINPILRLGDDLRQPGDAVVITYRTTASSPEPLRIVSDDAFDGTKWEPSKGKISRSNKVQNGLPAAPGVSGETARTPLRTEIATRDLNQTYLPLPYPATKVDIKGPWLYDEHTLNVVGDQIRTRNLSYGVDHLAIRPTAQQLQDAPPAPAGVVELYGKLPPTIPREIATRARSVAGTGTSYERAVALQQWFRGGGGFTYSENVRSPKGKDASSQDAVVAFLRTKRGYCVQFASAMAVMARSLGIPSRVGVGFLPGTRRADGLWEISVKDAHAWPELYFEGAGWVRFEPTPSARAGVAPQWSLPPDVVEEDPEPTPSTTAAAPVPSAAPQETPAPAVEEEQPVEPPLAERVLAAVPWRTLAVAALLAVLALVPLALSRGARARRWRRARRTPAGQRVEAAWDDLRERLEDLGVRWASSWTPRALQIRLAGDHCLAGSERAALGRLVADVEQVRYAQPGPPVRSAAQLRADVDLVVAGVIRSPAVPAWTRRRARWVPLSGWRTLTGAARHVDAVADEAGRRMGSVSSSVRRLAGRTGRR